MDTEEFKDRVIAELALLNKQTEDTHTMLKEHIASKEAHGLGEASAIVKTDNERSKSRRELAVTIAVVGGLAATLWPFIKAHLH